MGHDSGDQHADDVGLSEDLEISDGEVADGVRGGVKFTAAEMEAAITAKESTGLLTMDKKI
jgi:hypothetical protein